MKTLSDILFIVLTGSLFFLILAGAQRAFGANGGMKTGIALSLWLLIVGILAGSGFYADVTAFPPRLTFLIIPVVVMILLAAFAPSVRRAATAIPQIWLIGLQAFRIVMELILWMLYREGIVPVQMTFEGRNFDMLVGIAALVMVIPMLRGWQPKRGVIVAFNVCGLIILTNVVVIGLLSAPTPFRQFMNEPANTFVMALPYCWLPGIVVPCAYLLHIMSLRRRDQAAVGHPLPEIAGDTGLREGGSHR